MKEMVSARPPRYICLPNQLARWRLFSLGREGDEKGRKEGRKAEAELAGCCLAFIPSEQAYVVCTCCANMLSWRTIPPAAPCSLKGQPSPSTAHALSGRHSSTVTSHAWTDRPTDRAHSICLAVMAPDTFPRIARQSDFLSFFCDPSSL